MKVADIPIFQTEVLPADNTAGDYLPRRIQMPEHGSNTQEEEEFLRRDGPLVILGEPGSGKTALVENHGHSLGIEPCAAHELPPALEGEGPFIIDGIDEVDFYRDVWPKIRGLEKPNLVLACRTADWKKIFGETIRNRWQDHPPTAGLLCPLNEKEIRHFVSLKPDAGATGDKFVERAMQHGVLWLARNPQHLLLLLKHKDELPKSKLDLYEMACANLTGEYNQFHRDCDPRRHSSEELMEAAGFVFTLLLLSEFERSLLDELGEEYREAASTALFSPGESHPHLPQHRTVAEFLAAKWICGRLKAGNGITVRMIESHLVGQRDVVPSVVRGLHAWIATLSPGVTRRFIKRDPVGFVKYGDSSMLGRQDAFFLFSELDRQGKVDPHLFVREWNEGDGIALARPDLKDEISARLKDRSTTPLLQCLLIEAAGTEKLFGDLKTDLESCLLRETAGFVVRRKALGVLVAQKNSANWIRLSEALLGRGSFDSMRLVMLIMGDEDRLKEFPAHFIAQAGMKYLFAAEESGQYMETFWVGFIAPTDKLLQVLAEITRFCQPDYSEETPDRHKRTATVGLVGDLLGELLFKRDERPPPDVVARAWSIALSDWDHFLLKFDDGTRNITAFNDRDYRREIQLEILKSCPVCTVEDLYRWSAWLVPTADEAIFLMDFLVENSNAVPAWDEKWGRIARWSCHEVLSYARDRAAGNDMLGKSLERVGCSLAAPAQMTRRVNQSEEEWQFEFRQMREEENRELREMRRQFCERFRTYLNGDRVNGERPPQAIGEIAGAYLGWYRSVEGDTPEDRVAYLIGSEFPELERKAIPEIRKAATGAEFFRSAREIAELEATPAKTEYCWYPWILSAYWELIAQEGASVKKCLSQDLAKEGFNARERMGEIAASGLASMFFLHTTRSRKNLEKELKEIVYANAEAKEQFLRDVIEPFFERGQKCRVLPSVLSRNAGSDDVVRKLCLEWIEKYLGMSGGNMHALLCVAVRNATDESRQIVNRVLADGEALDPEKRGSFMAAAFALDYKNNKEKLSAFVAEDKERIWALRDIFSWGSSIWRGEEDCRPKMDANQNCFLISQFARAWPLESPWSGTFVGDRNPADASSFLRTRINALKRDLSDSATEVLEKLAEQTDLGGYEELVRDALSGHMRDKVENKWTPPTWREVSGFLTNAKPERHDQLQALVLDALDELQKQLKGSTTNSLVMYWREEKNPENEGHCRERIVEGLKPILEKHGIVVDTESRGTEDGRNDILCTMGSSLRVPIEVKGQWSRDLWTAANGQPQKYAAAYGCGGYGVCLVLWFGKGVPRNRALCARPRRKEMPGSRTTDGMALHPKHAPKPASAEKLQSTLTEEVESAKTKVFVLDLTLLGNGTPKPAEKAAPGRESTTEPVGAA